MVDEQDLEPGREVAHRAGRGITSRARGEFDPNQMELIRATVAKDCNPAELAMFLELCARYELDPFAKQIWAMKIRGAVQVVVSRDGLLSLANRYTPAHGFSGPGEFLGCESDVVRERDYFRKFRLNGEQQVDHEYRDEAGNPTASKDRRGKIIGAWAMVHRREHKPTYFFAEWDTYNTGQNVWKTHPEAMMQKCPETMALRKAFSVSGVIGETELPKQVVTAVPEDDAGPDVEWGDDQALADELRRGAEVLGWRRAKLRLKLRGLDHEGRVALLAEMRAEADRLEAEAPEVSGEVVP
jgi:phage recombination protein Bet